MSGAEPGALTGELVRLVGAARVAACDPSPDFVTACRARYPGVDVRAGQAEALDYADGQFDIAYAQLVFHFVSDPGRATAEMRRVVAPSGRVALCVWDFTVGMQMLRAFWDAALSLDPNAPGELGTFRFGRVNELSDLLTSAGLTDVQEEELTVSSEYSDFDELWETFELGIGPAGAHVARLAPEPRMALREAYFRHLGSPVGSFHLTAVARAAHGLVGRGRDQWAAPGEA
ncbi:methyltransferase domain-containing protein [Ammonicoccus fulvus]|uniref:Methyltransferase domain-containing protein n=1 Tax=Ammonicoccus fulvus TaxID=3138240 RepID=A0ABZ3FIN1_9ACTN